jgi:endonuclease III
MWWQRQEVTGCGFARTSGNSATPTILQKEVADTISAIVGNILSGSARDKNTLDWLEKLFGKIKQKSYSQSISQQGTTTSINEKMDNMIPAGKIAALKTEKWSE